MWLVWTGGNDRFWDRLTHDTFGAFDLLKTISSHPKLKNRRGNRWNYLGLTNEPCFDEATGPDPERFGLWLDQRRADCPPDPFANAAEISRRRHRRARQEPAGRAPTTASPRASWACACSPTRHSTRPRPRNGTRSATTTTPTTTTPRTSSAPTGSACPAASAMSARARSPRRTIPRTRNGRTSTRRWAPSISGSTGSSPGRPIPANYMYQLVHTQRPGTLDTSLVSTDYINNPRTMNAIYNLGPRLDLAKRWGEETLAGGELEQQAVQRLSSPTGRSPSCSRRRTPPTRRAC